MLLGMIGGLVLSILLFSKAPAVRTATLDVMLSGQSIGKMHLTFDRQPNGTYVETTDMTVTAAGKKIRDHSREVISAEGYTTAAEGTETVDSATNLNYSLRFTKAGANLKDLKTGKTTFCAQPTTKDLGRDRTSLWFVTIHPKKGVTEKSFMFSPENRRWTTVSTVYTGDKVVTVAGRKVRGHVVSTQRDGSSVSAIFEDGGMPLQVDVAGLHMIRE